MVFEEFVVPDPLLTGVLAVLAFTVALLAYGLELRVSQRTVFAFVPWMVSGAVLHVLYQMHTALEEAVVPVVPPVLLSAPSVYVTAFVLMGAVWLPAALGNPGRTERVAGLLGAAGTLVAVSVSGYAVWVALDQFALDPALPLAGLLGALALTALLYFGVGLWRPKILSNARYVGALVIFGHAFDGVTTAIGVELLDVGERSTVPRVVMDIAADLPTADLLGEAWLFVVVKLLIATALVALFHDYVREEPTEGNLFFAFMTAVGLGPASHNFFLFALGV